MAFTLTSPAFVNTDPIPVRHTCDGENLSPPLVWSDPPKRTQAFALVMDDPDAPSGTFTHWVLVDIQASRTMFDEGVIVGDSGTSGQNGFGNLGYGGPCPPRGHGPHHYRFSLHALRTHTNLPEGASRAAVDAALKGLILGTASLVGVYERLK